MKISKQKRKGEAKEDFEALFDDESKVVSVQSIGEVKLIDSFSDEKPKARRGSYVWDGKIE